MHSFLKKRKYNQLNSANYKIQYVVNLIQCSEPLQAQPKIIRTQVKDDFEYFNKDEEMMKLLKGRLMFESIFYSQKQKVKKNKQKYFKSVIYKQDQEQYQQFNQNVQREQIDLEFILKRKQDQNSIEVE